MSPQEGQNKLFATAAINKRFRESLLNPSTRKETIEGGHMGEHFDLTKEEIDQMMAIKAESLPEFARKLTGLE